MSNEGNRDKVLVTTKVRRSLKNDLSWIHRWREEDDDQENTCGEPAETRPSPARQTSYVLATAKLFEVQAAAEQVIPYVAAPSESSEAVSPVEPAQLPVANTTAESKEECVNTPVDHPTVEQREASEAYPAEGIQNGEILPGSKENPEAVSLEEPAQEIVAIPASANTEGNADAANDQSDVEHNEEIAKSSADVTVEEVVQNDEAQPVSSEALFPVPQTEPPVANTASTNTDGNSDAADDQSNVEHSEDTAKSSADVTVEDVQNDEAQPEKSNAGSPVEQAEQPVVNITSEKQEERVIATEQSNVESSEGATENSADAQMEVTSAEVGTQESGDTDEVPAALPDEPKPDVEVSTETEPADVANVVNPGVESTAQPAEEGCKNNPPEETSTEGASIQNSEDKSGVASEQATEETIEAVAEAVMESSPDANAVANEVSTEEAVIPNDVEPVPVILADTFSTSATQPAAETAATATETEVQSAAPSEPVPNTRAEEGSEREGQAADNDDVKQNIERPPETASDHVVEANTQDALKPGASDAGAVQDELVRRVIELTDALDVEASPADAVDPKQSQPEEVKVNQQSDDTNTTAMFEKPVEEVTSPPVIRTRNGKAVCSFCDQIIYGNVKITLSEPLLSCHPDCLKCGLCFKALGDMLTTMFLHDQKVLCDGCFAHALKA